MDILQAIGLGALAGGLVAFVMAFALRAFQRRTDPEAPRIRLEVVGSVLGAAVAGFVAPFVSLAWAVGLAALSPVVIPPLVFLLGFPFRPHQP